MEVRRKADLGPLHQLMLRACPPDPADQSTSVARLADLCGVSRQVLFKWINRGQMPAWLATRIVRVSSGEITLEDCHEFVYVDPADAG